MNSAQGWSIFSTVVVLLATGQASAERIKNPIALFSGLDKITGITTNFEINVGQEGKFGGLLVKPFVCFTRPITEQPRTVSFVEVDLETASDKKAKIFSGWMFAESPGLNGVEHPIFDVWLTGCKDPKAPPPPVEGPPKPADGDIPEEDTGEETDAAPTDEVKD
jgi:hypothetical protein